MIIYNNINEILILIKKTLVYFFNYISLRIILSPYLINLYEPKRLLFK